MVTSSPAWGGVPASQLAPTFQFPLVGLIQVALLPIANCQLNPELSWEPVVFLMEPARVTL